MNSKPKPFGTYTLTTKPVGRSPKSSDQKLRSPVWIIWSCHKAFLSQTALIELILEKELDLQKIYFRIQGIQTLNAKLLALSVLYVWNEGARNSRNPFPSDKNRYHKHSYVHNTELCTYWGARATQLMISFKWWTGTSNCYWMTTTLGTLKWML